MKATSTIGFGAASFVLLAMFAIILVGSWIEKDLTKRSRINLDAAGQEWALVAMDGQDAVLNGTAPDAEAAENALEVVSGIWGVRVVSDGTE